MIYSLNGKIIHKTADMAVIECGGVGYACKTTIPTLTKIGSVGDNVRLFTYMHITENALDFFGFFDEQELLCFKMLLSVSGVGPKAAISVLSSLSSEKFALAVASEDPAAFKSIKGIGLKTASRIVLELKDKLKKQGVLSDDIKLPSGGHGNASEAISALEVLGFSQSEAVKAVTSLPPEKSVEELIKLSLKKLSAKM
ncbi:MAG: Holliday junction branch migration protein RuvA [Ruminococcus sp.]|jgi:Holliday junction DNA helicase RuvA|nr:Holliday junction branch migration protein RuvA [Ruminococcus sp.]